MSTTAVAPHTGRHETAPGGSPLDGNAAPSPACAAPRPRPAVGVDRRPHADDGLLAEHHQAGLPGRGSAVGPRQPAQDARRNDVGRPDVRRQRNRPGRDDGQRADAYADRRHVDPGHSHCDSTHPRRGRKRRSGIGAVVRGGQACPHIRRADSCRRGQRDSDRHDDAGHGRNRLPHRRHRGDVPGRHRCGDGVRCGRGGHRPAVASGAHGDWRRDGGAGAGRPGSRCRRRDQQFGQRAELVLPHRLGATDAPVRRPAVVALHAAGGTRGRADGVGRRVGEPTPVRRRQHRVHRRAPERASDQERLRLAPDPAARSDRRVGCWIVPGRLGVWIDDQVAARRGEEQRVHQPRAGRAGHRRCLHHDDAVPGRRGHRICRRGRAACVQR